MSLLFKKLSIEPQGNITGGYFEYSIDPIAGVITYDGSVSVAKWGIPYSKSLNGNSKVDPAIIQSKNIKAGQTFDFGGLKVTVSNVVNGLALASVVLSGGVNGAGSAKFDLSQDVISLVELTLNASVPFIGNQTLHAKVL